MNSTFDENQIKREVNKIGKKQKKWQKFHFVKFLGKNKNSDLLVVVRNDLTCKKKIISRRLLRYGTIPFSIKFKPPEGLIKEKVNRIGKRPKNKYKRFEFVKLINYKTMRIQIRNIESKEILDRNFSKIMRGSNPFARRNLASWIPEVIENVNKWGMNWTKYEKFKIIKVLNKTKRDDFEVLIQNITSKEIKKTLYYSLKIGGNPFRTSCYTSPPLIRKIVNECYSTVIYLHISTSE